MFLVLLDKFKEDELRLIYENEKGEVVVDFCDESVAAWDTITYGPNWKDYIVGNHTNSGSFWVTLHKEN